MRLPWPLGQKVASFCSDCSHSVSVGVIVMEHGQSVSSLGATAEKEKVIFKLEIFYPCTDYAAYQCIFNQPS